MTVWGKSDRELATSVKGSTQRQSEGLTKYIGRQVRLYEGKLQSGNLDLRKREGQKNDGEKKSRAKDGAGAGAGAVARGVTGLIRREGIIGRMDVCLCLCLGRVMPAEHRRNAMRSDVDRIQESIGLQRHGAPTKWAWDPDKVDNNPEGTEVGRYYE